MADGILGLGSSGAGGLNQELIDKLKAAEAKAQVKPWDEKLENWDKELEKTTEIETKIGELLTAVKKFDLYNSSAHAFEKMSASTTGTSAVFNAVDVGGLTEGTNNINITQLAQRDVYQTVTFADKTAEITGTTDADALSIAIGGTTYNFSTEGISYETLSSNINANSKLTASVEQVGDESYRLVIKSTESGTANALTITQTGIDLGLTTYTATVADSAAQFSAGTFTINGTDYSYDMEGHSLENLANDINSKDDYNASVSNNTITITAADGSTLTIGETGDNKLNVKNPNQMVTAQNMQGTVDGVNYDVSSNTITIQGNLTMTAIATGASSISVQKDTSAVLEGLQEMATAYNELGALIDTEALTSDGVLKDTSSLKMIMSAVKDLFFGEYGEDGDKNMFDFGFKLDLYGNLSIDTTTFATALNGDFDGLKDLFIGTADKEGLGTQLKTYIDDLDSYDGLMTKYGETLADRKLTYEDEQKIAQDALDAKYSLMSSQFAEYTSIITSMEAAFGGMKMMMDQSKAS